MAPSAGEPTRLIVTVTLNAAVDKTYRIDHFQLDRVHRPAEWRIVAGGKGVNVARVYRTLGGEALASGFAGGYNGRFIERALQHEGMPTDFERTRQESRVCIAIVDPVNGTQTEINEAGPLVSRAEVRRLLDRVARLVARNDVDAVCLCGSSPPGAPAGMYARMVDIARERGVRCIVDTSGPALREAIQARPWMAKPNVHELSDLLGWPLATVQDIVAAACEVAGGGVEVVAATMGRDGAICVSPEGVWRATTPAVPVVSAVGSGDAFVAGFLRACSLGQCMQECLRLGTAAGTANAMVYGAGFCTAAQIEEILPRVAVVPLAHEG